MQHEPSKTQQLLIQRIKIRKELDKIDNDSVAIVESADAKIRLYEQQLNEKMEKLEELESEIKRLQNDIECEASSKNLDKSTSQLMKQLGEVERSLMAELAQKSIL